MLSLMTAVRSRSWLQKGRSRITAHSKPPVVVTIAEWDVVQQHKQKSGMMLEHDNRQQVAVRMTDDDSLP